MASRAFKSAGNGTTTAPKAMSDAEMEGVTAGAGPFNYGGLVSGQGNQGKLSDAAIANGFNGQGVHHAERP